MTHETRRVDGILLILLPSVMYGGLSILWLLIDDPAYMKNPLRQDLWRAGHAPVSYTHLTLPTILRV